MRSRPTLALLLLIAATALTACGSDHSSVSSTGSQGTAITGTATGAPPSSPVQVPGTVGYLNTGPGAITYLQWQADGSGRFSGTALSVTANGTPPNQTVSTSTTRIYGQINGTAFTLDINGHTDQGVLSGDTLALNVVQEDGSIRAITYRQATAADYNSALAQLQQTAQNADTQEQQRQSQANVQATAQDALKSLETDNNNFTNAKTVRRDLAQADSDLQKERQDAANGNGDNCYNIHGVVDYDARSVVGYDVTSSASYDVNQEQKAINGVRSDIQAVQSAEAALKSGGLPATNGASDAIATAQQHVSQGVATTNTAIDSLNADLTTAYSVANAAGTGSCAGDGPGSPPAGLSHIS
ncbi:hypothetical protein [Arthrobacter sp. MMS18-M83]|uniref:hypothetical protein n=1 Tax=Arthrobacter sp. MMS18-M83 TaxID=2996261 RepID=UPI00227C21AF|nr:hypothetical protein [Arthrobacter sp. MMS18-M83]WAH99743.1 hypothetical protein OW521_24080 [Arthrobacter sp. MMS18-M83]